ncbi:MAG: hypothetical protein BWX77_01455 [Bacteroidetes bacterium ADurb.Bin090]|nr:MAG: hypothetical protein BWX77_01455 [Bacteroidetes bacterium ADurb.Bin090]
MQTPKGGIFEHNVFDQHVFTFKKLNQLGTQKMSFAKNPFFDGRTGVIHLAAQSLIVVVQVGPFGKTFGCPSVYAAFTYDGNVF